MRPLIVLLAILLPSLDAAAPAQQPVAGEDLTLTFEAVDGGGPLGGDGDAVLAVGPQSAALDGQVQRSIASHQRVAIRLASPNGTVSVARLSAYLTLESPGCSVRVDGVALSALPRIVDPVHRVGSKVVHEVVIEIPRDVPPGPFASEIQWVAESE